MIEYLNNTVWATLGPSKIHGIGVIAIRDIPKGTKITDHSVGNMNNDFVCVKLDDFKKIHYEIRKLILDRTIFQEDAEMLVFPSPNSEQTLRSFMNHSGSPNSDGEFTLCDIKKGDEITEDYQSFYKLHELSKQHYPWLH